jgi:hypothetical protein
MPPPLRARVDGHDKNRVGRSNDGGIEGKYWDVGSRGGLWLGESASAAACERTERENRERPETYRSITPTHSETLTRYGRWRPQNASAQLEAVDLKARECAPSQLLLKGFRRDGFLERRARQLQPCDTALPGMLPRRARNADSTMRGWAVFFKSGPYEWSHLAARSPNAESRCPGACRLHNNERERRSRFPSSSDRRYTSLPS